MIKQFILLIIFTTLTHFSIASEKKIVTTIKPIHSILLNIVDSDVDLLQIQMVT